MSDFKEEVTKINPRGRMTFDFTEMEIEAAKDFVEKHPFLTYLDLIKLLSETFNLEGTSAEFLLEPIYLAQRSGRELVEGGYEGEVKPGIRVFLDEIRKHSPYEFPSHVGLIDHVAKQLGVSKEIAAELLYHQGWKS